MTETDILIIGGGPTGLGAAWRLEEAGADWHLLEAEPHWGGLSASFKDEAGFTWDLGGHVLFSHYDRFDRFMEKALGADGWLDHQRESWVWIRRRFVPYPFQNNLHRLDPDDRWACVEGLLDAWERRKIADCGLRIADVPEANQQSTTQQPNNLTTLHHFGAWMADTMGRGITELFLRPYNYKVWAWPPETMDAGWVGERVAVPHLGTVLRSICTGRDEVSWGPNRTFRFPKHGGTGAIWEALGKQLPSARTALHARVVAVDAEKREVRTEDGRILHYRRLISTMPLDALLRMTGRGQSADGLRYSSTHVIGVGMKGEPSEALKTKCWMYFPENNSPYYRITVFSNYSPNNVAKPGAQWSLMAEVAESPAKPVRAESVVEETLMAMEEDGLLPRRSDMVSVVHRRIAQGYPTPFLGRDALVDPLLRAFEAQEVYSRGRFGAWKYEVGNMDHSFAQGYECAERLIHDGGPEREPTLHTPHVVNGRRNA